MASHTPKIIILTSSELKDLEAYCELNVLDTEKIIKDSYLQGFKIEKYGLLGSPGAIQEKWLEKEVIVEKLIQVPVEIIVEKSVIEYVEIEKEVIKEIPQEVIIEKIVEVIKEVQIEKIVNKIEYVTDETKIKELLEELEYLRNLPPTVQQVIVEKEIIKEIHIENPVPLGVKENGEEKSFEEIQRLQITLNKIRQQIIDKDIKIKQLEEEIKLFNSLLSQEKAVYLRGSNLDNKLYK